VLLTFFVEIKYNIFFGYFIKNFIFTSLFYRNMQFFSSRYQQFMYLIEIISVKNNFQLKNRKIFHELK